MVADHKKTEGISQAEHLQHIQLSRVTELILTEGDKGRSDAEGLRHQCRLERDSVEAEEGKNRLTQSHAKARWADIVGLGSCFAGVEIAQSQEAQFLQLLGHRKLWADCRE